MAINVIKEKSFDSSQLKDSQYGHTSPWSKHYSPPETAVQGRFQAELANLVVYGEVPKEIDGTFVRMIVDPYFEPHPENGFVEGDGNICAFRFHNGRVDMKVKYIETERLLLERKANRRLFGIYRNPFTNHPCVRVANDSTGNTNIVYWNGQLLALAERGLPWAINHDTLETKKYNPFGEQVNSKTFSAHPKVDPYSNELVCWGYQAKGLGTTDIVTYSVDANGKISNQNWFKEAASTWPHDAWVTENWIILASMPFRVSTDEELQNGAQHWEYVEDWPSGFIVCPRNPDKPAHPGWEPGETRRYTWNNGLIIHTGASWEEKDGKLSLESHYVSTNAIFTFWNPPDMKMTKPSGSYVRWTLDLDQPAESRVPDPEELMAALCDFPKTDERFLTRKQRYSYIAAIDPRSPADARPNFNAIVKLDTETREALVFDVGSEGCDVAEPVFVPRSDDAPEGDGYVIACARRPGAPNGELVILDSNDFSKPVALVKLPFAMRNQVHGNWVPNPNPGKPLPFLSGLPKDVTPSDVGPLNRLGPR